MSITGNIRVAKSSLNLKLMLEGGQCFRWSKQAENKWIGVASKILWEITQNEDHIEYSARSNQKITSSSCQQFLRKYLRLDEDLESLYTKWSTADKRFASLAIVSPGLRMLDQEPIENIFSFICSSNNNITRISSMVEKMCRLYGEKVVEENDTSYHAFPSLESLAGEDVEDTLRAAGFGYRAKFIPKSAKLITEFGSEKWLADLTSQPYATAKQNLMKLDGVGPKVADCICLMSLGHLSAVPVDTHVFQLAAKYYLPHLKNSSSCTPKLYEEIHQHFLNMFGPYAGWAHTILFCAELKMFQKEGKRETKSSKKRTKNPQKRGGGKCVESDTNGSKSSERNVADETCKRSKNQTDSSTRVSPKAQDRAGIAKESVKLLRSGRYRS